jgi:predicted phosphodiesterase
LILHEHHISYDHVGDTLTLKPLADAHLGSRYCDVKSLKAYLSEGYDDPKCYVIVLGDLLDAVITKDMKRYTKGADASPGDDILDYQIGVAEELLKPYGDRIIGIGMGNHESSILKYHGTHLTRRLAKELNTVSLGYSALVRIRFEHASGGRVKTLEIRYHHGWGGGSRTQGADLTKFSRDMMYWDADLFLFGHVHRRQSDKVDRLSWTTGRLVSKPKRMFICGTFLKTLSETDEPTYSEEKGYPPVSIGGVNIKIRVTKDWLDITSDVD